MSKLIAHLVIAVYLLGCNSYSQKEINDILLGGSFLLITENQDSIQIGFQENCLQTYSWNYQLYEKWKVSEQNNSIYLNLDGNNFKFKRQNNNSLFLEGEKFEIELIKVKEDIMNPDLLKGVWVEERYLTLIADSIESLPPCTNFNGIQIPGIEFLKDSCIIKDFCTSKQVSYHVNSKFRIVKIGENCTAHNQWRIVKLTKDSMVVNTRQYEKGEIKFEENIKLIKYGG